MTSNKNMNNIGCHSSQIDGDNNRRRSANYKPNIWKRSFLQSLPTKYAKEESDMHFVRLLMEVKGIFVQKSDFLQKLELVDWIQKLGVANYFQKEVKEFLETTTLSFKNNKNPSAQETLYVAALSFRLLRQHGFKVSPDIFVGDSIINEKVKKMWKISCVYDAMELFEASHLRLEEENILEEAENVVMNFLKDGFSGPSSINIDINVHSERVVHAFQLPSHWRVPWFYVKWHFMQYQKDKHMEHHLLEFAKLNFNLIQLNLQNEVKELSRWWENVGIEKELRFARNRLVESFMCSAGVAVQPQYKSLRKWLTKVICLVLIIDDVYDIHASFHEVNLFTAAFQRWNGEEIEELPEYMRICFNLLKDVTDETAYEIGGENKFSVVLPYLKKAWIDFCNALYEEAKWYSQGYIPSLREYLNNAWISSSGPLILLHIYFATIHQLSYDEIDDFLHTYEDLVYNISLIIRLCNDLGTTMAERERGDAASSIICYMNEMDVSEEKAREHIQEMISNAWKKINWYGTTIVASMGPFLTQAINAARVAHTLYQNGDGFGIQDRDIKNHILSLVVEPL